jgi:hypothetical protein
MGHREHRVTLGTGDLTDAATSNCFSFNTAHASTANEQVSTGQAHKKGQSVLELYSRVDSREMRRVH